MRSCLRLAAFDPSCAGVNCVRNDAAAGSDDVKLSNVSVATLSSDTFVLKMQKMDLNAEMIKMACTKKDPTDILVNKNI